MRNSVLIACSVVVCAGACSRDRGSAPADGLGLAAPSTIPDPRLGRPTSASPGPGAGAPVGAFPGQTNNPHGAPNPHAGQMAEHGGIDPHAGVDGFDPHGGADPHGAGGTAIANPHAGIGQASGDPSQFLRGTLVATDATATAIKPGDIVFVSVKPIDPKTGALGSSLAVDRYIVSTLPLAFTIDASDALSGAPFAGKVAILARVDRDGEARTELAGDVVGRLDAAIPSDGLRLALDTVVQ